MPKTSVGGKYSGKSSYIPSTKSEEGRIAKIENIKVVSKLINGKRVFILRNTTGHSLSEQVFNTRHEAESYADKMLKAKDRGVVINK